jgi:hypothetical protein
MTTVADSLLDSADLGRLPRALILLRRLVAAGSYELDTLAEALVIKRKTLDSYLSGAIEIPLERQLCLALFVIEHVPALARLGYQLRGQVLAAIAFQERGPTAHLPSPPARF